MAKQEVFETERLILKPTSEEDAEFILALLNTPKWLRYIGDRNIKTVKRAEEYILEKITPQHERLGFSNYTLIRKADKAKIGTCGLYDREGQEGIDIGFAFLPEYEKKGYAFESVDRIKDLAFNEFDIKVISAFTIEDNVDSQKLLEKVGFNLTGKTKFQGYDVELLVYKIEK